MIKDNKYQTDNLALAPYLYMEGMKYSGWDLVSSKNDTVYKVVFIFEDPNDLGSELALNFSRSKERQYKNTWSFFRNEIENAKKELRGKNEQS